MSGIKFMGKSSGGLAKPINVNDSGGLQVSSNSKKIIDGEFTVVTAGNHSFSKTIGRSHQQILDVSEFDEFYIEIDSSSSPSNIGTAYVLFNSESNRLTNGSNPEEDNGLIRKVTLGIIRVEKKIFKSGEHDLNCPEAIGLTIHFPSMSIGAKVKVKVIGYTNKNNNKEISNIVSSATDRIINNAKSENIINNTSMVHISELKNLEIPTPYNTTMGVHPSVLHFPNKLNGYTFWMAFTPYPITDRENPCIVASNDGENWVVPVGLTNPIEPLPATGYNSDTELVYNGTHLYCYWRWYTGAGENILYRLQSIDGITWTNKTTCIIPVGVDPLSPSILVDKKNNWQMWIGANDTNKMRLLKSTDGITWTDVVDCTTDIDDFGFHWHPKVWREAKSYYCLSAVGAKAEYRQANLMTDLYFGKSVDGVNWEFDANPFLFRGEYGLNKYRVYRSCAVRVEGHHNIYVSGLDFGVEKIKLIKAKLNI